jgi:SWI/SNF-related matrix-associated actin-dependent regulator of chromatin subfamily A-like protein 1
MHLGTLRRVTGAIKAHEVVDAVKEEFDCGLEKIVLAYWHKEVGDILAAGLARFGVVRLDGSTSPKDREHAEARFRQKQNRVFLGQIVAAGEAIDLSSANELWFVETSLTPKDMGQMALRITNIGQKRNCFVRVCCIEGSIDEALQATLMRLWASIRKVVN